MIHHAPDLDRGTLVACGQNLETILTTVVSTIPDDKFLDAAGKSPVFGTRSCPDCVRELQAKIAADAAPPQSTAQTAALPKSKAGAGPDPR